jgi:hypothetical protein
MLKKKSAKKPEEHDFTALDEAVSELSKQTEALLGKTSEQPAKPSLPKKRSIPHTKGKSFDIIHDPKHRTALKASLKTAVVPHHKSVPIAEEPVPLLPDHATKSFNESESAQEVSIPSKEAAHATPIIQGHRQKLALHHQEEIATTEATPEELSGSQSEPATSHSAITFTEEETTEAEPEVPQSEPEVSPEVSTEPVDTKEVSSEPELEPEDEAEPGSKATEEPVEPPAYNSGELFANNLVKESKPHGYAPDENQQKPTVFDTTQYHLELHDWSKLERSNGVRWLTLLLLLVIAGALGYFVVSGQTLPF